MRKTIISIIIILFFAVSGHTKDIYYIGVLGNTENAGTQCIVNTFDLAFEQENTKNANFELKSIYINDSDGEDAVLKQITAQNNLMAITGDIERKHKDIIEKIKNIPFVSVNSGFLDFTTPAGMNTFRVCPSDIDQAKQLARFLIGVLKLGSFAVLYSLDDDDYAKQADAFRETVKKNGQGVMYFREVESGRKDFRNILINLRDKKVGVIFFAAGLQQMTEMAKQIKDLNVGATLVSTDELFQPAFIKGAKKGAEGSIATSLTRPSWVKQISSFLEKYEVRFKTVDSHMPFAYDTAMIIENGINENNKNPQDLINYLKKVQYKGATGDISFDTDGSRQENQICFYIIRGKSFLYRKLSVSEMDLINKMR